jgi:hypothetical protein
MINMNRTLCTKSALNQDQTYGITVTVGVIVVVRVIAPGHA